MQVSFKSIPRHTVRLQNAQSKCFHFTLQYIFKMTNTQDGKITLLDILYKVIVIHISLVSWKPHLILPINYIKPKIRFPIQIFSNFGLLSLMKSLPGFHV